jgi:predicted DNA-binding protein (UPF0251 family)
MVRPKCQRRISELPKFSYFKPRGVPMGKLTEISITVDELEAIRLADYEGMYHEQAAGQLNVSRQTFGRIVQSARTKVAQALIDGLALKIEGGTVVMADKRLFECSGCDHRWEEPFGTGRPQACPSCGSKVFGRVFEGDGPGRRRGGGGARGRRGGGMRARANAKEPTS